jgi:hypothetical protein
MAWKIIISSDVYWRRLLCAFPVSGFHAFYKRWRHYGSQDTGRLFTQPPHLYIYNNAADTISKELYPYLVCMCPYTDIYK